MIYQHLSVFFTGITFAVYIIGCARDPLMELLRNSEPSFKPKILLTKLPPSQSNVGWVTDIYFNY